MSNKYDELVERYILLKFREDGTDHLETCPDARVTEADARNGSYGCDTGCEYVRFEAVITCPHGESEEFEYGEFGELYSLLEDLEKLERREKEQT
jgi:hypothetical protein